MKSVILAFTKNGSSQAVRIANILKKKGYKAVIYTNSGYQNELIHPIEPDLKTVTERAFEDCRLIIFVGALGITVRAIAPYIKDKTKDPAVICIDDLGKYIIPVLSGHIGGANDMARLISEQMAATAVITTATDINGCFSVDEWAVKKGMHICNIKQVKTIARALLEGGSVGIYSAFEIIGHMPRGVISANEPENGIAITLNEQEKPFKNTLNLIPRIIHIGVGCRRGTKIECIEDAILKALQEENISIKALAAIASVDLKKDESGILELAKKYEIPVRFYTAKELEAAKGEFVKSEFVKSITSVDNVCERAAVLSSQNGVAIKHKTIYNGVTVALAMANWRVSFEN